MRKKIQEKIGNESRSILAFLYFSISCPLLSEAPVSLYYGISTISTQTYFYCSHLIHTNLCLTFPLTPSYNPTPLRSPLQQKLLRSCLPLLTGTAVSILFIF